VNAHRSTIALVGFIAIVVATNAITVAFGIVTWLGIAVTAGTWLAGFSFVARDRLQDVGGRRWVVGAILAGAAVSAAFSPQLALASCAAFLLSEFADFAVYTPLRRRRRTAAALLSNAVGSIVDSIAFLTLAAYPLTLLPAQVGLKIGTTTALVLAMRGVALWKTRAAVA
jgi:uncharacterized PurR-regulated membrane protein YhhQ (DUF165 family)